MVLRQVFLRVLPIFCVSTLHVNGECGESHFLYRNSTDTDVFLYAISDIKNNATLDVNMVVKETGYQK